VNGWNRFVGSPRALVLIGVLFVLATYRFWKKFSTGRINDAFTGGAAALPLLALAFVVHYIGISSLTLPDYRPINWLIDVRSGWPMFWVIFVYTWGHLGFYMLILLAGLQAIPKDLYEAAEMDGTSRQRAFWRITLPLLMPTMIVVLVLSLIRAFQVFDEVYVLTGGGPGQATKMIIQHVYESAFIGDAKRYGIAAASSVLVAGLLLVLTLAQLAATRKRAGG
jgi:ABC-type sugar transport system permease subunit